MGRDRTHAGVALHLGRDEVGQTLLACLALEGSEREELARAEAAGKARKSTRRKRH